MSGMLEWLEHGLTVADSGFAVLGGLIVAAGYSIKPLRRRWQHRPSQVQKQQTKKLDQLGLGRPLETIEAVLGSPHLLNRWKTSEGASQEERIYRLPGAWVVLHALEGAVGAYSITIIDPKLYFNTDKITRGIVPVVLGRSVFADARAEEHADFVAMYPRFGTFHRYYDYGYTAAGGQFIWLAYNPTGTGDYEGAHEWDAQKHTTDSERAAACDLSRITVNTIAICGWDLHPTMAHNGIYGPHPDSIR